MKNMEITQLFNMLTKVSEFSAAIMRDFNERFVCTYT